jgi:hypothetical protein
MIVDDPLSGFPTLVAGGLFFIIYVKTFVNTWKRSGIYYNLPPARRRGICFCWTCIIDTCFRRRCGLCGGKDAIAPSPPPSKFGGQKMDAATIEFSRPKASLMLKRLRANAATKTGTHNAESYNKYRMRSDDEIISIGSERSTNHSGDITAELSNHSEGIDSEQIY